MSGLVEPEALEAAWSPPRAAWLIEVNHKFTGLRFIAAAFAFHLAGFHTPDAFEGHATMLLSALPMMMGLALYLVPLMIGTREIAFPRAAAFAFYLYVLSAGTLWLAAGTDLWLAMISGAALALLIAAAALAGAVMKLRAPGMSPGRVPVFVWSALLMALVILFTTPLLIAANIMPVLDRRLGVGFFGATADPLLWRGLLLSFGHPYIYAVLLPSFGILAAVTTAFARRPLFGYWAVVGALWTAALIGLTMPVLFIYTTALKLPPVHVSSALLAIPAAVVLFCLLATLRPARLGFGAPLLFALGAAVALVLGTPAGTGRLMEASIFPVMAALYFWYPKITGRLLNGAAGVVQFLLQFGGFVTGSVPAQAAGTAVFIGNALWSYWKGRQAGPDPWRADTLEWDTPSPPPAYDFREIPIAPGRHPLWDWEAGAKRHAVQGLRSDRREVAVTTLPNATLQHLYPAPGPSWIPPLMAAAVWGGMLALA